MINPKVVNDEILVIAFENAIHAVRPVHPALVPVNPEAREKELKEIRDELLRRLRDRKPEP